MSGTITPKPEGGHDLFVERVAEFTDEDLHALCEATDAAIIDGGGFRWVPSFRAAAPSRPTFEECFWCQSANCSLQGLTGTVVGSAHLVRPPRNNEAQAFAAHLMHSYIAPYARGHGLATMLTVGVEERARDLRYRLKS